MIKIEIPNVIPKILVSKGPLKKAEFCALYEQDNGSYNTGKEKFIFSEKYKSAFYGSASVKKFLKNAHHKKCCYCESIFDATSFGAVEHYRPKGAVRLQKGCERIYPGYYWLAYEWSNLLYICERCNTTKSDYFPLEDETKRAKNHTEQITDESPLLIHPAVDNPLLHISFRKDAIFGLTTKGKTTIDYINLDRFSLFESRKEHLDVFEMIIRIAQKSFYDPNENELYVEAISKIQKYLLPSSEFSAMTNVFFGQFKNNIEFTGI